MEADEVSAAVIPAPHSQDTCAAERAPGVRCRRRPQRGSRLCWSHDPSAESARAEAERRKAEWRAPRGAEPAHIGTRGLSLKARLELARERVRARALIEEALAGLGLDERTEVLLDVLVVTALAGGSDRE